MERNVGTLDRSIRIIAGLALISLVFFGPQTPWGWIGLVPILTGLSGRCPAYMPFGIRTCPANKPH
ncbi:YgaP family membrane protein [Wenzhouxiangella sp. EGI_FJ10409]|uniref:YgaP family membrane protein n=1 Tax=Wenzhouxiangella sp. EGI_FJ10409 TaxID=3243767 RepID=UPI0035D9A5D1